MVAGLLPFIAGLFSLCLAFVVLVSGANTKNSKWPFVLFSSAVGVWALFIGMFRITSDQTLAQAFVAVYYIAALLIGYAVFLFGSSYQGKKPGVLLVIGSALPLVALSVMVLIPGLLVYKVDAANSSVQLFNGTYLLYSVVFAAYVVAGLIALTLRAYRTEPGRHLRVLAISLIVCIAGGAYFNLLLPWFGDYSLIELGPIFAFLMVFAAFYSIARHGLFDIRLAVVRTVTYVLSLATLAILYVAVVFLVFQQLLGQVSTLGQLAVNVGLTLILAFIFQPIKRFFDHLTNRLFYKDGYDANDFYEELNKILASTTDLRTLLQRASEKIARTLKSEQAFIFVFTKTGFVSAGTDNHSRLPVGDAEAMRTITDIMLKNAESTPVELRRMMVSHNIDLIMPLIRDHELVGYVNLGEHRTSAYSRRDRRVLQTTADELLIAIENALSVQEVKDLNANLEQRIESATKELRASNAQLQRLDEAKDEFISMASHQLRTPLTSIKGYISMLMDGDIGPVSKDQKHLLEETFMSSERMVRLISDFLNVSRLQTGKFVIEKHPVNLAVVVDHEVSALVPNAATRGLKFSYKMPKNIPMMSLDESKIQQVIMNFCDNAIYYSKEGSTIKVSLSLTKRHVELTVKDTGIGVPLEEQEQLFNKFFRATNARKQRPDGTGVGLFLAKKVIDAHHGQIIFESKPGKGSTFGFRLPLDKS